MYTGVAWRNVAIAVAAAVAIGIAVASAIAVTVSVATAAAIGAGVTGAGLATTVVLTGRLVGIGLARRRRRVGASTALLCFGSVVFTQGVGRLRHEAVRRRDRQTALQETLDAAQVTHFFAFDQ